MNWFDRLKLTNENLIKILVMVFLYVLVGNVNYFFPNTTIISGFAINMIIVVIAGILFGKEVGLLTGLMGTAINGVITGNNFEYAAIISHLIMGWGAGKLREKNGIIVSSLSIVIGHALNIISFLIFKLVTVEEINQVFWTSLGYESIFGIISVSIIVWIYLMIFEEKETKKINEKSKINNKIKKNSKSKKKK